MCAGVPACLQERAPGFWRGMRTVWLKAKGDREREAGDTGEAPALGRTELGKSLGTRGTSPLTDLHPFTEASVKTKPGSLLRCVN